MSRHIMHMYPGTRHYLQVYSDGQVIASWSASSKAITNMMEGKRKRTLQSALCTAFRPRFIAATFASTTNKTDFSQYLDKDLLRDVFTENRVTKDSLVYEYFVA